MRSQLLVLLVWACAEAPPPEAVDAHVAVQPLPAVPSPAAPAEPDVVADWEGGEIKAAELTSTMEAELRRLDIKHALARYDRQSRVLERLVLAKLLAERASALGITVPELLQREVEAKVPDPTTEELEAFYPVIQRQLNGATLEQARPLLVEQLRSRAHAEREADFYRELRDRSGVRISLPYPRLPRVELPLTEHDPILGPADAEVTIVQFAEYQCFHCGAAEQTLQRVKEKYGSSVRLVYKDFPASRSATSVSAAVAGHCAAEQERYWEMKSLMLANQRKLGEGDLDRYAMELGLDVDAFRSCSSSGRYDEAIREDLDLGRSAGVSATPTFFVNGIMLQGAQPLDRFEDLIDRELGG